MFKITHLSHIFIISLLSILLSGCFSQPTAQDFWVDNPTNREITIKIDEQEYNIPANSGTFVNLSWGKHQLQYHKEQLHFFVQDNQSNQAFINPTQSNYVIFRMIYIDDNDPRATEEFIDWLSNTNNHQITIAVNGVEEEVTMPFSVQNDIFVEPSKESWDYFLDEALPEDLVLYSPVITRHNRQLRNDPNYQAGRFQTTKKKIYREQEFITEHLQELVPEAQIQFILEKRSYADHQPFKIALTTIDAVQGDEYQNYLRHLEQNTNRLFQETDPKIVMDLKEELISVKATLEQNRLRSQYLAEKTVQTDNSQKVDYAFNAATNEYNHQMSIETPNAVMSVIALNFLIVE